MRLWRPLPAVQGDTLHIVGVGDNRIGKGWTSFIEQVFECAAEGIAKCIYVPVELDRTRSASIVIPKCVVVFDGFNHCYL